MIDHSARAQPGVAAPLTVTSAEQALPEAPWPDRFVQEVAAPADVTRRALGDVTLGDMPLLRALFTARLLPRLLTGTPLPQPDRPLLSVLAAEGFAPLSAPNEPALVLGSVDQPWKAAGEAYRLRDAAEFFAFAESGYVKIAFDVRLEAKGRRTRVWTETRVLATDADAARRFRRYWAVVRWGSALTRRSLLAAVRRRAEAAAGIADSGPGWGRT